ncbi:hypothetical protein BCR42DRAFT_497187 [Absidia repens]|uniref:NodB homology domain-containing protein n=1 Tax=Absidia repens TaxID=90262 RepID=A0A1X2HRB5_9FUNG|nr:hypothetical protein BCR42DRAFT_497187 [Absidia repens]
MYSNLLFLGAVALSAITAQGFTFKETYPEPGVIPTAKPEWLELLKNVNITKAPVYKVSPGKGPEPQHEGDPFCDWTFTGCFGKEDLYQCPKGQWAPTYDDGPSEFSAKLYDELDKTNTKATFFMVGGQVVKFPELALRSYKSGHEIAMHSWSHSYLTSLTNEQLVAELKWNELVIKEVTGVSPRFFRPPYGDIDDRVRDVAKALGFTAVIWTHDTNDWAMTEDKTFDPKWVDGNATKWANDAATAEVGGVSLEHDLYKETVDAAVRILPILGKSYKLTTVGDCNQRPSYKEKTAANATSSSSAASSSVAPSGAASGSVSPSANAVSTAGASSSAAAQNTENAAGMLSVGMYSLGAASLLSVALLS